MSREQVLLIGFAGCEQAAADMAARVVEHWPDRQPPRIDIASPDDVLDGAIDARCHITWVYVGGDCDDDGLYELLEHLAHRHWPTLITRAGETHAIGTMYQGGAVIVPPDAPADQVRLVIQTLKSQAETIEYLRQELAITQRHQGGVSAQMNKLDEELRLAARVQQEFMPSTLPQVGDVGVEVLFRPASYVSGDIYDVLRLDEKHIGLWIADVVGHGVPAALLTMFVRRALPTKDVAGSAYRIVPPSEALARLNLEMVNRPGGGNRFATAVYAVLNTDTHALEVARAGHPFPMLLRADDETVMLDPEGALLGVFAEESYESMTVDLEEGDRLLLFSDGFETAFGADGDTHDLTRYQAEFSQLRQGTPAESLSMLEQIVDAQPGSLHQTDDLTVIMAAVGVANTAAGHARRDRIDHAVRMRGTEV